MPESLSTSPAPLLIVNSLKFNLTINFPATCVIRVITTVFRCDESSDVSFSWIRKISSWCLHLLFLVKGPIWQEVNNPVLLQLQQVVPHQVQGWAHPTNLWKYSSFVMLWLKASRPRLVNLSVCMSVCWSVCRSGFRSLCWSLDMSVSLQNKICY